MLPSVPLGAPGPRQLALTPLALIGRRRRHLAEHGRGAFQHGRVASGLLFHTAAGTTLDQDYYGYRVFGKAVAEWLGHENATLVLTTYGHLNAALCGPDAQGHRRRLRTA